MAVPNQEVALQKAGQETLVEVGRYAGRLSKYFKEWKKLTQNKIVLDWVKGIKIPFRTRPLQVSVPPCSLNCDKSYDKAIFDLIKVGAVSECLHEKGEFVSPFFLTKKPNGKNRFILNLKELNKFIEAPHFKLEDFRTVTKLINSNWFLANIDLKDAYFLVPIHKSSKKYLRFCFNKKCY